MSQRVREAGRRRPVGIAGSRLPFITLPKPCSAGDVRVQLEALRDIEREHGVDRRIPVHVLIETHGALREVWEIAALPGVESLPDMAIAERQLARKRPCIKHLKAAIVNQAVVRHPPPDAIPQKPLVPIGQGVRRNTNPGVLHRETELQMRVVGLDNLAIDFDMSGLGEFHRIRQVVEQSLAQSNAVAKQRGKGGDRVAADSQLLGMRLARSALSFFHCPLCFAL